MKLSPMLQKNANQIKLVPLEAIKNSETGPGSYCTISDNESSSVTLKKTGNERQDVVLQFRGFNPEQSISKTFQF